MGCSSYCHCHLEPVQLKLLVKYHGCLKLLCMSLSLYTWLSCEQIKYCPLTVSEQKCFFILQTNAVSPPAAYDAGSL